MDLDENLLVTTFRGKTEGLKASVSLSSLCDQESVWPALAVVARVRRKEHNSALWENAGWHSF